MTPDQVAELKEGDTVHMLGENTKTSVRAGRRGKVMQSTDNFIRVDWVSPFKSTYDILRRTSPLWAVIEPETKP